MSNLLDSLKPLYYGAKILGMSPYEKIRNAYVVSRYGHFYPVFFILFIMTIAIFIITDSPIHPQNIITMAVTTATININVLSTIIIYIYEIKNQKGFCEIIESLNEIDNDLIKLGVQIPHKQNKNMISFMVYLLYCSIGAVSLMDFIAYHEAVFKINRLFLTLLYIIPLIVHCCMTWIICIYLGLLKQRFRIINNVILEQIESAYKLHKESIIYDHKTINKYFHVKIISSSKIIHHKLCGLFGKIVSMYSIQALFAISISYILVFTRIYFWYSAIRHRNLEEIKPLAIFHSTSVMILNCVMIFGLALSSEFCVIEARKTSLILCKIANTSRDITVMNSVRPFIYQIIATMNEASVAGFFTINRRFIHTIIGSASTYLVILIQFDLSMKP